MSDHFQKHLARVKAGKGKKWSSKFDLELATFKLCSIMSAARKLAKLTRPRASELSGVPERIIAKIEREETDVDSKYFDALFQFYMRTLAETEQPDRVAATNRLGALVASMSPRENQFAVFADWSLIQEA